MKHIRAAALLLLFILAAPAARAQTPLPPEVVAELQKAADICHKRGQNFGYDNTFLTHTDVTVDGLPDYIISSGGYLCDNTTFAFDSKLGNTYHIFQAMADGRYIQHTPSFRAYDYKIDERGDETTLKFTVACDQTLKNQRKGETRMKWDHSDNNFEIRARDLGCAKKKKKDDDNSWLESDDVGTLKNPFRMQD